MTQGLDGKRVVASSGGISIGKAIAKAFVAAGAPVHVRWQPHVTGGFLLDNEE